MVLPFSGGNGKWNLISVFAVLMSRTTTTDRRLPDTNGALQASRAKNSSLANTVCYVILHWCICTFPSMKLVSRVHAGYLYHIHRS